MARLRKDGVMIPFINTCPGDGSSSANDYVRMRKSNMIELKTTDIQDLRELLDENILAIHYANSGAQGDAGAVEILYCLHDEVQILYGNYCRGNLSLDEVMIRFPMLNSLDSRYIKFPYPFGGSVSVPDGWGYLYMGAMNHLFVKQEIAEKTQAFIGHVIGAIGGGEAFDALAWFCGAAIIREP